MPITPLIPRTDLESFPKVQKSIDHLESLLAEIRNLSLSEDLTEKINTEIDLLNNTPSNELKNAIAKRQQKIVNLLVKEGEIIPKHYFRDLWKGSGVSLGLVIGVAIGGILDKMGMMALGLPIGIALGSVYGNTLDQKAEKEGRQLNWKV